MHNLARILLMTATLLLADTAFAGGPYLGWHTIDSGGGRSSGDNLTLTGTIGQHDAYFTLLVDDGHTLTGGFWAGAGSNTTPVICPGDLTGDAVVNAADLAALLGSWSIPPGSPGCSIGAIGGPVGCPADLNTDGFVNAADLAILLGAWGSCE